MSHECDLTNNFLNLDESLDLQMKLMILFIGNCFRVKSQKRVWVPLLFFNPAALNKDVSKLGTTLTMTMSDTPLD